MLSEIFIEINEMMIKIQRIMYKCKIFTAKFCRPGDEHGDVLADDKLLSTSSGRSTEVVRRLRL